MAKVIDCFLFFQELELLDIRLDYLNNNVDIFVIVESKQAFSGVSKEYIFELNKERYKKYLHKIVYYKIDEFYSSYDDLRDNLSIGNDVQLKILNFLEANNRYSKKQIHWVLDTYHRECIHIPLSNIAKDEDLIIISDLDEIPNIDNMNSMYSKISDEYGYYFIQKEFRYFLNYYYSNNWIGSNVLKYIKLKNISLNDLRYDSKKNRNITKFPVKNGGYHFTNCGGIAAIKSKIEQWGHQEMNTSIVINNLEDRIKTGQDIFLREHGTKMQKVDIYSENIYDKKMSDLISMKKELISDNEIKLEKKISIKLIFLIIVNTINRIKRKIKSISIE
ncbi:hypothetical protein [Polynucleobacter sp. Nonnen-W13]|uniref:hypothetical protein n=1 Tax=Polynucleobacter sp. Nonnen-W13 TaxID=1855625 RepID=UPI001C0D3372|nr:hypothetical protein [Polynucleobacter sp. Nonnen-W13]MBU3558359.1 hypothetical protein [Polynucleobacter sp. Nonnen-W13]